MALVTSRAQDKWSRLRRMPWKEICTRLGQEVSKRYDFVLYRAGLGTRTPDLRPQGNPDAKFFFGTGKGGAANRAELLRKHLPHDSDAISHEADNICRHKFHLLGYEDLDYGATIDWHSDPVHGKRSPLQPWFKINFLDYRVVGDHKVIWELNRHQHLVTLAKAWLLTNNPVYAEELAAQFYSWQKANPYPLGINWASALELAFRSLSWLWVRNLMADCPALPAGFHTDLLIALQAHGRYIERYLSTYFSPNTHLLGEAVALFFIGALCPEISAAKRWGKLGWKTVLEESERQVRHDGVYFEQAFYYHVYALDFLLHARHLASQNGFAIPEPFDNVLKKMLDVVQALSEVGPPEGFGDDDGGRVFHPRRNRVECMIDPLAIGALLYDCDKYTAATLTEEAIWLFGDKAVKSLGKPAAPEAISSKVFEAGGLYLINDDEPRPQQLMIDAGPQGTGNAGHGHADALSLRFSLDRHRFLIDPGTYCYISDGEDRHQFRGTGAHNTLRVDKLDQAVPEGPFAWSSIPRVKTETWVNGQTFDFFVGNHDGYRRLPDPVLHRRFVFHVRGGSWFVRDVAEGRGSHQLETFWHFAPDLDVKEQPGGVFVASLPDAAAQSACLALLIDRRSAWTTEITEGVVSPAYGSKQVAPVVRASASATLPEDCAVMLLPMARAAGTGTFSSLDESSVQGVRGYRYRTQQTMEFLFLAQANAPWTCGLWASDAELLYCKLERDQFTHVIMVSGSFGEWRSQRFVSHPAHTEIFEWVNRPGSKRALSSAGDVVENSAISSEVFDSVS
jgi:hypothetical protein